jgi:hypothetical protein
LCKLLEYKLLLEKKYILPMVIIISKLYFFGKSDVYGSYYVLHTQFFQFIKKIKFAYNSGWWEYLLTIYNTIKISLCSSDIYTYSLYILLKHILYLFKYWALTVVHIEPCSWPPLLMGIYYTSLFYLHVSVMLFVSCLWWVLSTATTIVHMNIFCS